MHHCGISGDRPRGHTSLTGAVDFQLKVWKDDGNVYTEVEWLKEGEEGEVLASRLEQVEVGKDKHGNTITSCVVVPSEANPTVAASGPRLNKNQQTMFSVLYATGGQGLTTEEWNRRMRDDAGIGVKRKADLVDIRGQLEVRGAPFSVAGLQKMVERAGTEAKMPFKVHPHMLRHATGFALANKGTDTRTLQAYLGHRSIQSTVRYTELAPGRFKNLWR